MLPDLIGSNHDEFVVRAMVLVDHHTLPIQGAELSHISEVDDILRYSGKAMKFMGKADEEVHVWEHLLDILHD